MKSKILGLVAVGLLAGPVVAQAASVTANFAGSYLRTDGNSAVGLPGFAGATISGSYTFNDTAANCGSAIFCSYNVLTGLSGAVSGGSPFTFGASSGAITVQDNGAGGNVDQYGVGAANSFVNGSDTLTDSLAGFSLVQFILYLQQNGNPPTCITSTDLPKTPPATSCFPTNEIWLKFRNDATGAQPQTLVFNITSLGKSSVPEPGTLALLGLGLAGLGLTRRRKAI